MKSIDPPGCCRPRSDRAGGNGTAGTAMAIPVFEGEKTVSLELQSTRVYSPPVFFTASGCSKYDHAFSALFWGFEHPKLRREDWGFLTPFGCETSPWNVAGLMCAKFSVARLRMMATFKIEAKSSHLANPHHTSASRVWKNCSCETCSCFRQLDFDCFKWLH